MTIALTPDLEQKLAQKAQELGTTPESFILGKLQEEFAPPSQKQRLEPQDEWERRLRQASSPAGVALSDEAVSSEGIY
ncbi:MAG: hypothetical protein ACRYFS_04490 [Janthinobacterium lividum]